MYIDPFVGGVLSTIGVELLLLLSLIHISEPTRH